MKQNAILSFLDEGRESNTEFHLKNILLYLHITMKWMYFQSGNPEMKYSVFMI